MADQLFTCLCDLEVLKSREPAYTTQKQAKIIDHKVITHVTDAQESDGSTEANHGDSKVVKTFVSILNEGCERYYDGAPPTFSTLTTDADVFIVECRLRDTTVIGKSKTKKGAKQAAAKEMLKKLIEKNLYKEFALGSNPSEAYSLLELISTCISKADDADCGLVENWVGKVNEKCQKLKLEGVVYDINMKGPKNQPSFVALCKVGSVETTGIGRTKKAAKAHAAQEMLRKLETMSNEIELADDASINEKTDPTDESYDSDGDDLSDLKDETLCEMVKKIIASYRSDFSSRHCAQTLQNLINEDDPIINDFYVKNDLKFTVFQQPDVDGSIQCLLAVSGPGDEENVFTGFGNDEQASKDDAARSALKYLAFVVQASARAEKSSSHPV